MLKEPEKYRSLIGKLLYLNLTRPDISYSVQQLSQFMSEPRDTHWKTAVQVVKYLKGTSDLGLFYPKRSSLHLTAFCDADWGNCNFSGKSLTGWCIFLGDSLVTWKTKKQETVSKSSTEAEFRSMSHTTSELVWVVNVFQDLQIQIPKPISLFCDNIAANHIAQNAVFHKRTKHLKLDCYYVREHTDSGFLATHYIKSSHQIADVMTKSLSEQQHKFFLAKLGLVYLSQVQLEGGVKRIRGCNSLLAHN